MAARYGRIGHRFLRRELDPREAGRKARGLGKRRKPCRRRRERARRAAFGRARRSAARHRLRDRCRDRAGGASCRRLPAGYASADRLPDRVDCGIAKPERSRTAGLPAWGCGARAIPEGGVHAARRNAVNWLLAFSAEELTAIRLSLRVAFWAMLGSLPPGLVMALLLSRGRFWGKALLNVVVYLPLVLPPVVTGYVLLLLFGRRGPLGRVLAEYLGLVFAFRWTGAALACA